MPLSPDPEFGSAWFDVDEVRDSPVPHRYVHGGFEDTNTLFRICLPERERYDGRLIQLLNGGQGGNEFQDDYSGPIGVGSRDRWLDLLPAEPTNRWIAESARRGAIFVQSNEGFRGGIDPAPDDLTLNAYRATAHTAWYATQLAAEHYGRAPEFRYVTGWSGGGERTINALEQTSGVFHGGIGGGMTAMEVILRGWSVVADACHLLRDVLDDVLANADAGGTGDLLAAARTPEQREILTELYRAGFPFGNERALRSGASWHAGLHYLPLADPDYVDAFFETPGYAGHDGRVERLQGETTVVPADDSEGTRRGLRFGGPWPAADLLGSDIEVIDGPRAGSSATLMLEADGLLFPNFHAAAIEPGDRVSIDNGRWLALRHYWRDAARRPAPRLSASLDYTGVFDGKMLLVDGLDDHVALTSSTVHYDRRVADRTGYRIWWLENAEHSWNAPGLASTRYIDWVPAMAQSLDDLIAWVEQGVEPAPSTEYTTDEHGIVRMPDTVAGRGGIQPVVRVTADDARRAEARAGAPVELVAVAEAPEDGSIVEVAWDVEGTGDWVEDAVEPGATVTSRRDHVYSEAGAFLAAVRVRSQRPGSDELIENLGRARIVVT